MTGVDDHEFSAEEEEIGEDSRSPSKELPTVRENKGNHNSDNTTVESTKGPKAPFKESERSCDGARRNPAALRRVGTSSLLRSDTRQVAYEKRNKEASTGRDGERRADSGPCVCSPPRRYARCGQPCASRRNRQERSRR